MVDFTDKQIQELEMSSIADEGGGSSFRRMSCSLTQLEDVPSPTQLYFDYEINDEKMGKISCTSTEATVGDSWSACDPAEVEAELAYDLNKMLEDEDEDFPDKERRSSTCPRTRTSLRHFPRTSSLVRCLYASRR